MPLCTGLPRPRGIWLVCVYTCLRTSCGLGLRELCWQERMLKPIVEQDQQLSWCEQVLQVCAGLPPPRGILLLCVCALPWASCRSAHDQESLQAYSHVLYRCCALLSSCCCCCSLDKTCFLPSRLRLAPLPPTHCQALNLYSAWRPQSTPQPPATAAAAPTAAPVAAIRLLAQQGPACQRG